MKDQTAGSKVIDDLEFRSENESLAFIETTRRTIHIDPPIPLEIGKHYRVEITAKGVRVWELLVDTSCKVEEVQ
jgi:hypothetical protein